jgi:ribulose-phosphate 3-epimerase
MELVPAILAKNKREFIKKIKMVAPYVKRVQFDIMDGKFVPNKTWGRPKEIAKVWKNLSLKIKFEAHLMVKNNQKWLRPLVKENAERIFFHFESSKNPKAIFDLFGRYNKKFKTKAKIGMAINPETRVDAIKPYLKFVDSVLVMGVTPGFSGQKFQKIALGKIKQIKKLSPRIEIGVDGGVSLKNAKEILSAGADYLVAASAIFGSKDIKKTIEAFKNL